MQVQQVILTAAVIFAFSTLSVEISEEESDSDYYDSVDFLNESHINHNVPEMKHGGLDTNHDASETSEEDFEPSRNPMNITPHKEHDTRILPSYILPELNLGAPSRTIDPADLGVLGVAERAGIYQEAVGHHVHTSPELEGKFVLLANRCHLRSRDVFQKARDDIRKGKTCVSDIINEYLIVNDLKEAAGNWKKVFDKYCRVIPLLKHCTSKFSDALEPCLNDTEMEYARRVVLAINLMAEYFCLGDGEHLARYVANNNVDCNKEKPGGFLNSCSTKKLSANYITSPQEDCENRVDYYACAVSWLKTCQNQSSADFFVGLSKYMYAGLCVEPEEPDEPPSSSHTWLIVGTVIVSIAIFLCGWMCWSWWKRSGGVESKAMKCSAICGR